MYLRVFGPDAADRAPMYCAFLLSAHEQRRRPFGYSRLVCVSTHFIVTLLTVRLNTEICDKNLVFRRS
jgi:hypothetical protein